MKARFILASSSPRRKQLLDALGAAYTVRAAEVDESPLQGEDPSLLALRLAGLKATAVQALADGLPVLAADTVVALDGELLAKPADAAQNEEFLARLSGREHQVITGHVLLGADGRSVTAAPQTTVRFRHLPAAEIRRYAATGEGLDKAGGYGLQGLGGALVDTVTGCHTNVIGLSLPAVIRLAAALGVPLA